MTEFEHRIYFYESQSGRGEYVLDERSVASQNIHNNIRELWKLLDSRQDKTRINGYFEILYMKFGYMVRKVYANEKPIEQLKINSKHFVVIGHRQQ